MQVSILMQGGGARHTHLDVYLRRPVSRLRDVHLGKSLVSDLCCTFKFAQSLTLCDSFMIIQSIIHDLCDTFNIIKSLIPLQGVIRAFFIFLFIERNT